MKKLIAWGLALLLALPLGACSKQQMLPGVSGESIQSVSQTDKPPVAAQGRTVYCSDFKTDAARVYQEIAKAYQKETGVPLSASAAASGAYGQALQSKIAEADALEIKGIFAAIPLSPGEDGPFYPASRPVYYKLQDNTAGLLAARLKPPAPDQAMEFLPGRWAMEEGRIRDGTGHTVQETYIRFLPADAGVKEIEKRGFGIGAEKIPVIEARAGPVDPKPPDSAQKRC